MNHIKLYESYQSLKEIEQLAQYMMDMMAQRCLESGKYGIRHFHPVRLGHVNAEEFPLLKDFLKDFHDMGVEIVDDKGFLEIKQDASTKAVYIRAYDALGEVSMRDIYLRMKSDTLERVNSHLTSYQAGNIDARFAKASIASHLFSMYAPHFVHEMQHAYDDWRSDGKALKDAAYAGMTPRANELSKKVRDSLSEEESAFIDEYSKRYLNLEHEVDARFASAMHKLKFCEWDFNASLDKHVYVYKLMPFEQALRKFKLAMSNFGVLTAEQRKRILQKFGQFYEIERTFVAQKNAEEKPFM